jgi:hypothetical protein
MMFLFLRNNGYKLPFALMRPHKKKLHLKCANQPKPAYPRNEKFFKGAREF